ncbi:nitroreductase family protein [Kamptonema cortianum]|nr:nitroreductase family protein [Geitlerinema splendidum]MDK3162221.1 nitroreductase family protein [Kamptonema cortianum]
MDSEKTVRAAAFARRSIRKYTDRPLSQNEIADIVAIAGRAPSPSNLQPWRVVAVVDADTKTKLMEACNNQSQVGDSAATLVVYTDMEDTLAHVEDTIHPGMSDRAEEIAARHRKTFSEMAESDKHWWGRAQGYTFMAYLLLEAESRGLGTSPMLGFDPDKVKSLLNLPSHAEIPVIIAMGTPNEDGFEPFRHKTERILRFI